MVGTEMLLRWDPCVKHDGADAWSFIADYFGTGDRATLLVAGAGFDPRATLVPTALSAACGNNLRSVLFREERRTAEPENRSRAEANVEQLSKLAGELEVVPLEIFAEDGAVTGGRRAVAHVHGQDLTSFSDVVLDLSALSKGVAFPLAKLFLGMIDSGQLKANLHLVVVDDDATDARITPTSSDKVEEIHGFGGGRTLSGTVDRVQLWIPHLVSGQQSVTDRIFDALDPDEVCPILPFPSRDPCRPSELLYQFREQIEGRWEVSEGGFMFASESDPLDLYRATLRVDSQRAAVFAESRGALTVVSPLGSKALSIGALMAALERNLPIVHVEAVGYDVDWEANEIASGANNLVHIWLAGDAYAEIEET